MSNETKLFETLKKASSTTFDKNPFLDKNTLAIHYGDCTWINKKRIVEDLKELKEKILACRNLYAIDLLIEKIEKL